MAAPATPQNMFVQAANGQIFVTWDQTTGANSYSVQRSTDNVNFTVVDTPSNPPGYLDTSVTIGTQYWYRVAAVTTSGGKASATLTFSGQPTSSETVTIANIVFTAGTSFVIGATATITATNLTAAINASSSLTNIVTASLSGLIITITAVLEGEEGNGLQFSEALTNVIGTSFSNGLTPGQSPYTEAASEVPTTAGEMSLGQIRLNAQRECDRQNSNFLTTAEWNFNINNSLFELYDLLIDAYEDYYFAEPAYFTTNGSSSSYPLPNGVLTFQNESGGNFVPPPFYKLCGVDLGVSNAQTGWVSMKKYMFADRNKYFYPNTQSTIYGVFNMQYRLLGQSLQFIPLPSGNQPMRMWYIPRMVMLLKDTDLTTSGVSGWMEYVIVDAAIKALEKEESDTQALMLRKAELKRRIEAASNNRDQGQPDTISDTRGSGGWGQGGSIQGFGGGF